LGRLDGTSGRTTKEYTRVFMKIIFDESLLNDTIKISPRRVFRCVCGLISLRKDVRKIRGKYFCRCGKEVEDITNRETGQDFMEILHI